MIGHMTKIKSAANGGHKQIDYLNQVEYLANGEESARQWHGKGAERLGLTGAIDDFEQVKKLAMGFDPTTGEALTQKAGDRHAMGTEFTFSPDKTISLLAGIGTEEQRAAILAAHDAAVKKALNYAEAELLKGRVGADGELVPAEIVAARFRHDESRELDPTLHEHVLLFNLAHHGQGKSDGWGALQNELLINAKQTVGQIYQNTLAIELQKAGLPIEFTTPKQNARTGKDEIQEVKQVKIAGISKELCDKFSKRSKQIKDYLKENNLPDTFATRQQAWSKTRKAKNKEAAADTYGLISSWKTQAAGEGFDEVKVRAEIQKAKIRQTKDKAKTFSVDDAIASFEKLVMEKHGSNSTKEALYKCVLQESMGTDLSIADARKITEEIFRGDKVVGLGKKGNGQERISTTQLLHTEDYIRAHAITQHERHKIKNAAQEVDKFAKEMKMELNDEQRAASIGMLATKNNVFAVLGRAGTGKTYNLKVPVAVWKSMGYEVVGTSMSGKASDGLRDAGMNKTMTIASLLYQVERGEKAKTLGGKLLVKSQEIMEQRKIKHWLPTEKTVIVIDEHGLTSTDEAGKLTKIAEKYGCKVICVGDPEQLQGIGTGGIHKLLCDDLKQVPGAYTELKQVFRQKDKQQAGAGLALADGSAIELLDLLKKQGNYYATAQNNADISRQMAKDFTDSKTDYKGKLFVAETRGQSRDICKQIRDIRIAKGEINAGVEVEVKDPNEKNSDTTFQESFSVGDRMLFLNKTNAKYLNAEGKQKKETAIKNGQFGTIESIRPFLITGEKLGDYVFTVKMDDGRLVEFNNALFKEFTSGYGNTIYKGQGATVQECFASVAEPDKHKSYVAATRNTMEGGFKLYTTEEADRDIAAKMSASNYNLTVREVLDKINNHKAEKEAEKELAISPPLSEKKSVKAKQAEEAAKKAKEAARAQDEPGQGESVAQGLKAPQKPAKAPQAASQDRGMTQQTAELLKKSRQAVEASKTGLETGLEWLGGKIEAGAAGVADAAMSVKQAYDKAQSKKIWEAAQKDGDTLAAIGLINKGVQPHMGALASGWSENGSEGSLQKVLLENGGSKTVVQMLEKNWIKADAGLMRTAIEARANDVVKHMAIYAGLPTEKSLDSQENKAIHVAAQSNNAEAVRILASYGANIEATNAAGETPLCLAMRMKNFDAAKTLSVDLKANKVATDKNNNSPFMYAALDKSGKGYAALKGTSPISSSTAQSPKQRQRVREQEQGLSR